MGLFAGEHDEHEHSGWKVKLGASALEEQIK
jgi:hypothetical protein